MGLSVFKYCDTPWPVQVAFLVALYVLCRYGIDRSDFLCDNKDFPTVARNLTFVRTLSYETCDDLVGQRLVLVYGALLARELNRQLILPYNYEGTCTGAGCNNRTGEAAYLTLHAFVHQLKRSGLRLYYDGEAILSSRPLFVNITALKDPVSHLQWAYHDVNHIHVSCPLYRVNGSYVHRSLNQNVQLWLTALQTTADVVSSAARIAHSIADRLDKTYNLFYVPSTTKWPYDCSTMSAVASGACRVFPAQDQLQRLYATFDRHTPIYALQELADGPEKLYHDVFFSQLRDAGYTVVTNHDLKVDSMPESLKQAVLYELCMRAGKFLGHSFSTMAALVVLQRRLMNKWSGYYNYEQSLLSMRLPLEKTPWLFVYEGKEDDLMLHAAIISGVTLGHLQPYCLATTELSPDLKRWLIAAGVIVVKADNLVVQHLPAADRSDLELLRSPALVLHYLPGIEQYNHVLFTAANVFFLKEVRVPSAHTHSRVTGMGKAGDCEGTGLFIKTNALYSGKADFLRYVISNQQHKTPQGKICTFSSLMEFYNGSQYMNNVEPKFYTVASVLGTSETALVHFDTILPKDYVKFFQKGTCPVDGNSCIVGLKNGACVYGLQWCSVIGNEAGELCQELKLACQALFNSKYLQTTCSTVRT